MHIASITSGILPDGSLFEIEVHINAESLILSGDPKGYVKKEISRHLAGCIANSGIPINVGMWTVTFTQSAQRMFDFPGGFVT